MAIMEAMRARPATVQATAMPTCAVVERLEDAIGEEEGAEMAVEVASAFLVVAAMVTGVEPIEVVELEIVT